MVSPAHGARTLPVIPAVLLLTDRRIAADRQSRLAWRYAFEHRLAIVALAGHDTAAAVSSVRVGRVRTVLAAVPSPDPAEQAALAAAVEVLGGAVVYARALERARAALDAESALIVTALANTGGDVELVAKLLGRPVEEVRALAGVRTAPAAGHPGVRPQLRRRPEH